MRASPAPFAASRRTWFTRTTRRRFCTRRSPRAALVRRTVHTKHGANPYYTRATLALARVATRTLTAFVSVSEGTDEAAQIRERPARRIAHVIPNGVPLDQFGADPGARGRIRTELKLPESAVVVGTVGRLAMEKDYPLLGRAAAPLLGEGVRLVIVGEGDHRGAIEAAIAEHLPGDRRRFVTMTGGRSDVQHILAAFDVFVLSSRTEGLPLVIPEAMASRLPIVATAVGGFRASCRRRWGDSCLTATPRRCAARSRSSFRRRRSAARSERRRTPTRTSASRSRR